MAVPKGPSADLHPLDAQFQNLGLKQLDPIPSTSKEFSVLRDLLRNTKGETHNACVSPPRAPRRGGELMRASQVGARD